MKIKYKAYCEQYPSLTNTELAKLIKKEHRGEIEKHRSNIRHYRHCNGDKDKAIVNQEIACKYKKYHCPDAVETLDYTPIKIEANKVLMLADIHIPYHSRRAVETAVNEGKRQDIDAVILSGDQLDCYRLSKFPLEVDHPGFEREISILQEFLQYLRGIFPNAQIIYKASNHEARYRKYLLKNAPELAAVSTLSLDKILELQKYNIKYVPNYNIIRCGNLYYLHGDEIKKCPSKDIPRILFNEWNLNMIFGHYHTRDSHIHTNPVTREVKGSWTVGCLSDLQPPYKPYNCTFLHGFAITEFADHNKFFVQNKLILNEREIHD